MNSVFDRVRQSPVLIRAVPFVIFVLFTSAQGKFFENSQYWFYLAKVPVGLALLWFMRPIVREMRWAWSGEALLVGVAVFVMWVGIDPFFPKFGQGSSTWRPFESFADQPVLAWLVIAGRLFCSTLVVPPMEEVFYRSFLYRYIIRPDVESVALNHFKPVPFAIAAIIFGVAHFEWLSAILCAAAYHALIFRKNRLGDAMTAHAITNFLLGLWVVWRGAWNFW